MNWQIEFGYGPYIYRSVKDTEYVDSLQLLHEVHLVERTELWFFGDIPFTDTVFFRCQYNSF